MPVPPDPQPESGRTRREIARRRDEFMLERLKERSISTTEMTDLLNQAGEQISSSGVRARLHRLEKEGLVYRVNRAGQGKEVEWACRPQRHLSVVEQPDGTTCEVSSVLDLSSATATVTITITGSVDEILERLSRLVSPE